jgi:hypothetical protein
LSSAAKAGEETTLETESRPTNNEVAAFAASWRLAIGIPLTFDLGPGWAHKY